MFTVPAAESDPAGASIPLDAGGSDKAPGRYAWLEEFSRSEFSARSESPRTPAPAPIAQDGPLEMAEPVETAPPASVPHTSPDEDRSWITGPERPFWQDLLASFVFFLDPSNLVTFIVLVFVSLVSGFVPLLGWVFSMLVGLYVLAFYLETVREAASGSDQLPEIVWISSWVDLLEPLGQFLGTVLWVLLPAMILAGYTWYDGGQVAWQAVGVVAAAGLVFWPVVVLQTAIGGKVNGLWPHTVVRTALSAPLGYAAVCAVVLASAGIHVLPLSDWVQQAATRTGTPASLLAMRGVEHLASMYATIVAMRAIGLFYRHFKHRFPWVAE